MEIIKYQLKRQPHEIVACPAQWRYWTELNTSLGFGYATGASYADFLEDVRATLKTLGYEDGSYSLEESPFTPPEVKNNLFREKK